jgi:hypothetical protein
MFHSTKAGWSMSAPPPSLAPASGRKSRSGTTWAVAGRRRGACDPGHAGVLVCMLVLVCMMVVVVVMVVVVRRPTNNSALLPCGVTAAATHNDPLHSSTTPGYMQPMQCWQAFHARGSCRCWFGCHVDMAAGPGACKPVAPSPAELGPWAVPAPGAAYGHAC